jgi:hypothetical protein
MNRILRVTPFGTFETCPACDGHNSVSTDRETAACVFCGRPLPGGGRP